MGEGLSLIIKKNLPISLERAWNLLASERGLHYLFNRVPESSDSVYYDQATERITTQVTSSIPLYSIDMSIRGPGFFHSSITIEFIAKPRITTVLIFRRGLISHDKQLLLNQFWHEKISKLV